MSPEPAPSAAEALREPRLSRGTIVTRLLLAVLGVGALLGATSFFVVNENETVIVLRVGRPVRIIDQAGLQLRWPWPVESVTRVDRRLQYTDLRVSEALTSDKRNVVLHAYFAWRVENPPKYVTAVGQAEIASARLNSIITSAKNAVLGRTSYSDLVSLESGAGELAKFEKAVLAIAQPDARENLGVEVASIGIKQVSLPEANISSVFERMRAERKQYASKFRSEGKQMADELRAKTDAERAVTLAEARRYAEETRGKGEAEAARIFAATHGKDPEFYEFLRKLQSLRTVVDKNTTLVLDTDVPPFDVLKSGAMPPPQAAPIAAPPLPREPQSTSTQPAAGQGARALQAADAALPALDDSPSLP